MVALRAGKSLRNIVMGIHLPESKPKWVNINSEPLFQLNEFMPYAVVTSFTDITEQRQAEESLRASEAKNAALLNAIPDIMILLNRDGLVLDYHTPSEALLAIPAEQFLNKNSTTWFLRNSNP